jgi:hypothetical protein
MCPHFSDLSTTWLPSECFFITQTFYELFRLFALQIFFTDKQEKFLRYIQVVLMTGMSAPQAYPEPSNHHLTIIRSAF